MKFSENSLVVDVIKISNSSYKLSVPAGDLLTAAMSGAVLRRHDLSTAAVPNVLYVPLSEAKLSSGTYTFTFENKDSFTASAADAYPAASSVSDEIGVDPSEITDAVDDWLEDHPEATTTVEDGAVTAAKIASGAVTTEKIDDGAVTSAKLGADVVDILNNKANIDGSYSDMTVGLADQLQSNVGIEDKTPYNFRTSGGSTEIGDREELNAVVGATVAWNQLVPTANRDFTSESSDTRALFFVLRKSSSPYTTLYQKQNVAVGILSSVVASSFDGYAEMTHSGSQRNFRITPVDGFRLTNGHKYLFSLNFTSVDTSTVGGVVAKDISVFDLTLALGSTIADYIYALEQSSAGSGVAYFRKLFPKPYYAYNAGELLSVQTNLHRMVGFNAYNPSTGKAKVVGGMVYQITGAYTALSLDGTSITPDASGYFTPSANGELTVTGGNGTTTCIHLKWDGERDGEYEPYEAHEYALSDITLRGILKLDANNNLYADGDRYLPDGTVDRRFAERAYQSGDESLADAITDGTTTVYKLTTPTTESADPYQQTQIVDDFGTEEFVDAAVEANERDVAVPVGNETVYKPNLRAKLEMMPDSPDGAGDYIMRSDGSEQTWIPLTEVKELPDVPTTDGTYVLKCTVSDGTATLTWVSE